MTITTAQESDINKSMKALERVSFGSMLASRGVYTVTAGEASAGTLDIITTFTGATGFLVQVYRSDVNVAADADITLASGVLTVADGGATYAVTAGDIIHYILF